MAGIGPCKEMGTDQLADRVSGMRGSPIDSCISLIQGLNREVISFAMGCPPAEAIPTDLFADILAKDRDVLVPDAYNYGPTEGERDLRRELLRMLAELDTPASDEQLLVTSGGTQGIDLVCKLFVNRGDLVICESPTYSNAIGIIRAYEGDVVAVPVDANGIRTDMIPDIVRRLGRRPKLLYVIPNFQNPAGVTMSLERRVELLALARHYGSIIIEDDPYSQLFYDHPPPMSLWKLDKDHDCVIAVHTSSKILAPGLRVGWVLADARLIGHLIDAKQALDTCTSVLSQRVIAAILRRNALASHLAKLRKMYASKLRLMRSCLSESFQQSERIQWTEPKGGFFLWLTWTEGLSGAEVCKRALQKNVAIIPGTAFGDEAPLERAVRLCFVSPSIHDIESGVRTLGRIALSDS